MSFGKSLKRKTDCIPNHQFNSQWKEGFICNVWLDGKSLCLVYSGYPQQTQFAIKERYSLTFFFFLQQCT